jgi:hypothetical protein
MATDALTALVHDLAADPRLVDDVVSSARAQFPEVARLPWAESRRHVAALLAAGFAAFARPGEPEEDDFAEAVRFGAERAALGVPVAGLLSGVHAGRSRLLEIAITRGRAAGLPYDVLLQALLRLDRYGTALERHVVEGYRTAERDLDRDRRAARIRLLRRLLLGEHDEGPRDDPAQFGLPADGSYHCVVSDATEPAVVRALEQSFARCGGVLAPVAGRLSGLTPRLSGPAPRLDGLAARQDGLTPRQVGRAPQQGRRAPRQDGPAPRPGAAAAGDPAVLVVTTPPVPLHEAPAAYRLVVAALHAARARGSTGTLSVVELAGETALAAQPLLARFLRDGLPATLDPADGFHRELVCTALAYLDHGQRLDRTAAALHLHPNTVRYRLRRLQELTGFGDPGAELTVLETVRWWWALRAWSHSPGPPRA